MFSRLGARLAAVHSVCMGLSRLQFIALGLGAFVVSGCTPHTLPPLAGADPADASVAIAPASYRSSTSSYQSMRPSEPTGWRKSNDDVTPPPQTDRGHR
jgi:hypothetical protein